MVAGLECKRPRLPWALKRETPVHRHAAMKQAGTLALQSIVNRLQLFQFLNSVRSGAGRAR